jgi:hypothetical protein
MGLMAILPKRKFRAGQVNTGVRLPADMLKRLDEIAASEDLKRNAVIYWFLEWALEKYERDLAEKERGAIEPEDDEDPH